MSTTEKQAMAFVRDKAKGIHLTQRSVALKLGVSLPTVKRWWAGKGVSVDILNRLCSLLGVSLSQLFLEIEGSASKYVYSLTQEKMLVDNPRVLALFDLLVSGETTHSIQRKYSLSPKEMFPMLLKLDRVGLIELHEHNKIKLKRHGEPQWIVGGPLSKKYRKRMIDSFLGDHPKTEVSFHIHDYLPEDVILLRGKFRELENLMHACNARAKMQTEEKISYGSYLCLRSFAWDLRGTLNKI
jgi:transcriptional regulator with XRE-family HTH domain